MSKVNERAEYYASLPEYYMLEELRTMIMKPDSCAEDIIKFIKQHHISVNSYVKGVRPNEWVPILHLCCKTDRLQQAVKFLIKSGADINLAPDAGEVEPLLMSCDLTYFRFLVEHGCKVDQITDNLVKRKLRSADIKRLKLLVKTGHISVNRILSADPDTVLYSLTSMKDYLMYAFNIRKDITNFTAELTSVLGKFLTCVNQLIEWGAPVSKQAVSFCVEYYLYEFLVIPAIKSAISAETPVYHEYKDKLTVAILRPLLNDARYERMCLVMGRVPSKEVYNLKF